VAGVRVAVILGAMSQVAVVLVAVVLEPQQ